MIRWHWPSQPLAVGQNCPCGDYDCWNNHPRSLNSRERTISYRKRAGSRKTKHYAAR